MKLTSPIKVAASAQAVTADKLAEGQVAIYDDGAGGLGISGMTGGKLLSNAPLLLNFTGVTRPTSVGSRAVAENVNIGVPPTTLMLAVVKGHPIAVRCGIFCNVVCAAPQSTGATVYFWYIGSTGAYLYQATVSPNEDGIGTVLLVLLSIK